MTVTASKLLAGERVQRRLGVVGDGGLDLERGELVGDQRRDRRIVLDDQDPPCAQHLQRRLGERRRGRQPDLERGAAPGAAGDADLAALEVDQRLDDRQAEAGARDAAVAPGRPIEAVEHVLGLLGRHADSRVGDDDPDPGAVRFGADVDPAALRRVQMGIGEEVPDHLTELVGIGQHGRHGRRDVDPELLVLGLDPSR